MIGTHTTIANNYPPFIEHLIGEYFKLSKKDRLILRSIDREISDTDIPDVYRWIYNSRYREDPIKGLQSMLGELKNLFTWKDYRTILTNYNSQNGEPSPEYPYDYFR
jgi:hypothetical protein